MKKYLIERNNKYFTAFGNEFDKKGKSRIKPIYGTIENAVYFSSLTDAQNTAIRVNGKVVES
ncbi:Uncharacterised protein [Acholeplasma oculi]|uniref:Phage protein L2_09 of Acholeplasma phage L2 n=1 Tax=Acholeplasma oculi TaxID=35623 RepID=A0A061AGZ5_9MOLU|nr:hypothetical protein [Acholeplasma oculi]CDR30192.1 Phage protein L2_09 of Acholeplasma phage L2 [Acholeplasma oculi]SKC36650.1 hypothetical protein SAMN02745122_0409 [Acholeplasma oculi]SKC44065.1 hypothetical protein SAMN02745122_1052 [Acholeplasma oculi]SUT88552.1 Uncharacterised protein [Acholeplasma oculi]